MWQKIIFKCKIRVEKIIKLKFSFLSFHLMAQMALDGKAIKEEIPDKEAYDSGSVRRVKGEFPFWHFILIMEEWKFYLLMRLCVHAKCCVDIRLPSLINQLVIDKKFPTDTINLYWHALKFIVKFFFIRSFMNAWVKIYREQGASFTLFKNIFRRQ